ncbi:methyltransferase, TIGR04325 family [Herbaspirillum rhizosphaerae]|uniref:methyltransferase, TIGR04325 family n=1 Tax=Herbaspirillum rhizosphaerae TaxID=346179 RepID=UPI00067E0B26|nr:methyltransferase, TIGR04325 family [Herbaspirillum rhizosphaerae]
MKNAIKSLIPPVLFNAAKKIKRPAPVFSRYADALAQCQNDAYENDEIIKVVVEKNLIYKNKVAKHKTLDFNAIRTLLALGIMDNEKTFNVLDFGGGGGYHHAIAKIGFRSSKIKWNVVETTAMAKEAQRLAGDDLRFFDNIDIAKQALGEIDLLFSSSALQYCPDPLAMLQKLVDVEARHLFITRTAFNDAPGTIIAIQRSHLADNGPGPLPDGFQNKEIAYPISFVDKAEVEKILTTKYDIRFAIEENQAVHVIGDKEMHLYGYFCDLRR